MVAVAALSAKMVVARGSRATLLLGYLFFLVGFAVMLVLWDVSTPYWAIALAYIFVGLGVGFAGTPASHSLTASVPVHRAGMASGTADLQRDLGGAVMQSILGVLLTVGYGAAIASAVASSPQSNLVNDEIQTQLQKSYAGAEAVGAQYPQYASVIEEAARKAFLEGSNAAYAAGIIAILIAVAITWFAYPRKQDELDLVAQYQQEDTQSPTGVR